ncbi:hypothetical protein MUDAN_BIHEEGNE_01669 [Lactiplantibacillus mudanjiangensis]|uniref:hypothetical protein n=1 Tax=Lactiplantibacillus mudanjiangensis TaxID=1296538 RepID=UPI0010144368|nr:hypothetical protein [Lactiplantibacillus mudanjiangensis]VDG20043.1 hypothetical protein MUDAN_BIHEEGNE_01669 [Lactiplantibacillus mudanjiangensis]VDG33440.1 hypothetical protein MUDAN_DOGOELCO_02607 [Lactiplantibacillus mudanjiangensis]
MLRSDDYTLRMSSRLYMGPDWYEKEMAELRALEAQVDAERKAKAAIQTDELV